MQRRPGSCDEPTKEITRCVTGAVIMTSFGEVGTPRAAYLCAGVGMVSVVMVVAAGTSMGRAPGRGREGWHVASSREARISYDVAGCLDA